MPPKAIAAERRQREAADSPKERRERKRKRGQRSHDNLGERVVRVECAILPDRVSAAKPRISTGDPEDR